MGRRADEKGRQEMIRKLTVGLALVAALGASAIPAGAAAARRTETFEYTGFGQVEGDRVGVWVGPICIGGSECVVGNAQYRTLRREKAVSVKIVDDQGAQVRGVLVQKDGLRKAFCGSSGRVPIRGGKPLGIWISANPCGSTPSGAATTGTVTTTFFRK
jgi:hypothetical protein